MKTLLRSFLFLPLLVACDNELEVNADYENLTVLYCVLNPEAPDNFARVQRGYLGDAPAAESYDEPDSLYYDTSGIEVLIRQYEINGTTPEQEALMVYDESLPLDPGIFANERHYLYRVPASISLERDKEYEIVVIREDGSESSARTGIAGEIDIDRPIENPGPGRFFNGQIQFDIDQGSARMIAFQPIIFFNYRELDLTTGDSTYKTEEIRLPTVERVSGTVNVLFSSNDLTQALAGRIEADPNIIRFFIDLDIEVWGAAEDLVTYYQLNEPSTGINQNRPEFVQVSNGTGLVSSRTVSSRTGVPLEQDRYFQDLLFSDATCDLQFVQVKAGRDTCFCRNGDEFCL